MNKEILHSTQVLQPTNDIQYTWFVIMLAIVICFGIWIKWGKKKNQNNGVNSNQKAFELEIAVLRNSMESFQRELSDFKTESRKAFENLGHKIDSIMSR